MKTYKPFFYIKPIHFCFLFLLSCLYAIAVEAIENHKVFFLEHSQVVEFPEENTEQINSGVTFILCYDEYNKATQRIEYNLNEFAKIAQGVNMYKIYAKQLDRVGGYYLLSGTPTVLILKDGEEINRIVGVVPTSNLQTIYRKLN